MSAKRHQARVLAMQAIYQWQLNGQDTNGLCAQFIAREPRKSFTVSFFTEMVEQVTTRTVQFDESLQPLLGRSLEGLDPVERAIIRLGAYELSHHPEVPYRVVINEWVAIAKEYGAEQGHRFVNGVLDKLAKSQRAVEVGSVGAGGG